MTKRPVSITVIGWLFIGAGAVGVAYHAGEFDARHPFDPALLAVLLVRLLAILGGAFVLRGSNWARWLVVVWMAFHVGLSAFHSATELIVHGLLFVVITWLLFRSAATAWFRKRAAESSGP